MSFKLLFLAPPVAIITLSVTLALLDHGASYRTPLAGAAQNPPRVQALADLAAWRVARAEEEARLAELLANLDTEIMVELGREIVHGRGLCFNCHRVGPEGHATTGPNLDGVGTRAGHRVEGMNDVEYLTQSLYNPKAFVVEGHVPGMTPVNEAPMSLSDLDVLMVIAYLQSLGGAPTVGPDTELEH